MDGRLYPGRRLLKYSVAALLLFFGMTFTLSAQELHVTFDVEQPSCGANNDGSATAIAGGGTAPYSYRWNTGATTQSIYNLNAGHYTVTVTDWRSNTAIKSIQLSEPINISCNIDITQNCGQATFTASARNGVGPYSYSWSNGASGSVLTVNASGVYCLTITDANGCKEEKCREVNLNGFSLTTSSTGVACNGYQNGSASAHASGGRTPYTYSWSNGGASQTITGLGAGVYTVTVTDADGCSAEAYEVVESVSGLNVNLSGFNPSCEGSTDGKANAQAMGGTAPYTYRWSNGQTNSMATGLGAGVYYVTVSDANACQKIVSVSLVHQSNIVATVQGGNTICTNENNGNLTASASSGVAPYTYRWSNGATSNAIGGLGAGTYTVTVTDAVGCSATASGSVNASPALTITLNKQNPGCSGGTGSLTANVGGGTAPYTYSWNNGGSSNAIGGLGTGTYTVVIYDANGCRASATETIYAPAALTSTISASHVACHGGNAGTATVQASGGTAPYSYSWNNGGTSNSIGGLAAGTYSVTITDANGCTTTQSVQVNQPSGIVLGVTSSTSCAGGATGTATANASGGTGNYQYRWSNGGTSNSIGGLAGGTYTVTVTDANGCTRVASVVVNQNAPLQINLTKTDETCGNNDGTATASVSGGTGPYTYSWSNGGTSYAIGTLNTGTYTLTVSDARGCTATQSITINDVPGPDIVRIDKRDVSCAGSGNGQLTVVTSGGTQPYSYRWSNGGLGQTITGLGAGTYTVTVYDSRGCSDVQSMTINAPSALQLTAYKTNVACHGGNTGTATANANGGTAPYSYSWNNFGTSNSIGNLSAGTYTVTVTDANGCTRTSSVVVEQPSPLNVNLTKQDATCGNNNGTVTATTSGGSGGYSYSWSNFGTSNSIGGLAGGTYTVTVTDANGCTATQSMIIYSSPNPDIVRIDKRDVSCAGSSNGQLTAVVQSGTAPYSYRWSNGGTSQTITNLGAGTYTVTVSDARGCSDVQSMTINAPSALSISTTKTNVACHGGNTGTATANANGGTAPYSYSWNNFGTSNSIGSLSAGTYTVTVTDANGCTRTSSVVVEQPSPLNVNLTKQDATCGNNNGTVTATTNGGSGGYSYSWSNFGTSNSIGGLAGGTYTVTVTDANGCTAIQSMIIYSSPNPDIVRIDKRDVSCAGSSNGQLTAVVQSGTAPYSYRWSNGGTSQTITNLGAGTYTVTVSDARGCSDVQSMTINAPSALSISTTKTDVACHGGSTGTATANASGGTAPYSYSWNNFGTSNSIGSLSAGTYTVTVTDANGCTRTASVVVGQPSQLNVSLTKRDASCGNTNGTATATASGGSGGYSYSWNNFGTSNSIGGLAGGTYTVTVTDGRGCTTTQSIVVNSSPNPDIVRIDKRDVSCAGYGNGQLTAVVESGTAPYNYRWSNGGTGATINNIAAGTYTVTVTDARGCSDVQSRTVNAPSALSISSTKTDVACHGGNTGTASVSVSGGNAPYSYSWSNFGTSNSIGNLSVGTYTVTITDANGCTSNASVVVGQPSQLNVDLTKRDENCDQDNGTATANVSGGTTPYTYRWNNFGQSNSVGGLNAGTYTVTVSDARGCTAVQSITVNNIAGPNITNITRRDISCGNASDGQLTAIVENGATPYTYRWSNSGTSATIGGLGAGTYTVTVTDANGCTAVRSMTLAPRGTIETQIMSNNVSCHAGNTGSASVTASGGSGPYTFRWSNGSTSNSIGNVAAGEYAVVVSDANGCTVTRNVVIGQPSAINVVNTRTNTTCGENNGVASASANNGTGPYTYRWDTGATGTTVTGLSPRRYYVTVTDANGCTAVGSSLVNMTSIAMVLRFDVNNPLCHNGTNGAVTAIIAGGRAPYSYIWSNGNSGQYNNNISAGTYSVTATDADGCTTSDQVTVGQPGSISLDFVVMNAQCDDSNGSLRVTANGGAEPYSYAWSNFGTSNAIGSLSAGNYRVTVTDANGCTTIGTRDITAPNSNFATTVAITNASCRGGDGTAIVNATGDAVPYSYRWSTGATSRTVYLAAGSYRVTTTDANGCESVDIVEVTHPSQVGIDLTNVQHTSCGDRNGTIAVNGTGGAGGYSYAWSNGATGNAIGNLNTGSYTVTVTDANGCTATRNIIINGGGRPEVTITKEDIVCASGGTGSMTANVTGGTAPYSYSWNNFATSNSIGGLAAGTYSVTVSDANGCTVVGSATIINAGSSLGTTISSTSIACNGGNSGTATVNVTGGATPYTYSWNNGGTGATITGLAAGTYTVIVYDANGCQATNNVDVQQTTSLVVVTDNINHATCGNNNGSISVSTSGGTAPYSYAWNNSGASNTIGNLGAGTYTVTVTDANGCTATHSATANSNAGVEIVRIDRQDISCSGGADGTLTVVVRDGTTPYSYSWSNGGTGASISGLGAGTYTVTVSDANGCTAQASMTLTQPESFGVTFTATQASCGEANGSATANPTGGAAPYSYYWNTGAASQTVTGLAAGVYTVNVSDANGCTVIANVSIIATNAPNLVRIDKQDANCHSNANGSLTAVVEGGSTPYTYAWNNGGTGATITGLIAGTYSVTVTGANGCSTSGTMAVNAPASFGITFDTTNPACGESNIGSATVNVTGGTAPYSYAWNNGGTNATIAGLGTGTYSVTITDANGCTSNGNVTINAGTSDLSCDVRVIQELTDYANPNAIIEAWVDYGTSPYSFAWNTGSYAQVLYDVGPGNYTVTVTDGNGCTTTCSINIGEICYDGKNITNAGWIGPDRVICGPNVEPGEINSSEPARGGDETCEIEYLWLYNYNADDDVSNWIPIEGSNSAGYDPGPITQTTYFIRCARRGLCPFLESNPVRYEVSDIAVADIDGPDFVCVGEEVTYTTPDTRSRGGFTWSFTGATPIFATNTEHRVVFHTVGFQYVTLTVEREGCISSDTLRVFVTDSPELCSEYNDDEDDGDDSNINDESDDETEGEGTGLSEDEDIEVEDEDTEQDEEKAADAFLVYPNPAGEQLSIDISQEYGTGGLIELVQMDGTTIQTVNFNENQSRLQMNIAAQAPGLYLIKVTYDNGAVMTQKVMKQ